MIKTFQDFQAAKSSGKLTNFINEAITEFKGSELYLTAIDAKNYYEGKNTKIMKRMQWFYDSTGTKKEDNFKANNRIATEFYTKITKQLNSYLLGNGVRLDTNIKDKLGKKVDINLQKMGMIAQLDGVAWSYCYIDSNSGDFTFTQWRGTEFIPLEDEMTGQLKAGIRFWQIDINKPMWIELYEEDGKTTFRKPNKEASVEMYKDKEAYIIKKNVSLLGEDVIGVDNWNKLPIIRLYANDFHKSTFTPALKSKIDLVDIIDSDFGNNLEDSQDVYWVLKNYAGQDIGEFLADYKEYKTIKVDSDGSADPHTIQVPYEARKVAIEMLRDQIFEDAMALDVKKLTGGAITATAIKAATSDLDLKADAFENELLDYIYDLIGLLGEYEKSIPDDYNVKFIRRTLTNDTETIQNIALMRSDIDERTALKLNPYIDDDEVEGIIKAKEEEASKMNSLADNISILEDDEENKNSDEKSTL